MSKPALTALRLLLAALAIGAALGAFSVLIEVFAVLSRGVLRWSYTAEGLFICALACWAALGLWRFRKQLDPDNIREQIMHGGARGAAGAGGFIAGFMMLGWSGCLLPRDILSGGEAAYAVLLPALAFASAAGLGVAYEDALKKSRASHSAVRLGLYAAALGGVIGCMSLVYAGAGHILAPYHDMALQVFVWAAACGMTAVAALQGARREDASLRRFALGYAGAFICAVGGLIPAAWLESFIWGRGLLESWNVLIFFMPFICIGTVAAGGFAIYRGWRIYRRAF